MNFQCFSTKISAAVLAAVTMATPAFAAPGTVNAEGGLRLRNGVGTDAAIITTLPNGAQVDVSGITDEGWFQVSYQDTRGYVSGEYLILNEDDVQSMEVVGEPVYGRVIEGPLNVRSAPTTDSKRLRQVHRYSVLQIIDEVDGWYELADGFVSADYVEIIDASEAVSSGSGSEVVDYAMQFLGCAYVYGGTSPRGFDCSGLVKYVFSNFGVTTNRTASAQMDNGTPVSMSELIPGDVVFFKKSGSRASRASHVGIYIGDGQFIHASTSRTGVIISDLDSAYYTTGFVGARRML